MTVLSQPRWQRFVPPLLAFLLVAALGFLLLRPAPQKSGADPLVGQPAPDFTAQTLTGQTVHLAALKGQPVVLNFWASWCGPCQEEAPLLHDLSARQAAEHFQIVGLLFQETSADSARRFIAQHALNYSNILSAGVDTGVAYGISGIPDTFFIDKNGVVQHLDRGGLTRERLNVGLEKIGVPPL